MAVSQSTGSVWKIIHAQQQQLNKLQSQIDRIMLVLEDGSNRKVGASDPYLTPKFSPSYAKQRDELLRASSVSIKGSKTLAIGDSQRSVAPEASESEDEDFVVAREVERLVQKYSLRE